MKFAPRSFRVRIMLLSISISAAILLGFAWRTWVLLDGFTNIARLDGEMKALGHTQLASARRRGDWAAFENTLTYLGDLDPSRVFAFVAMGRDKREPFVSERWPEALPADTILAALPADLQPFTDHWEYPRPPQDRPPGAPYDSDPRGGPDRDGETRGGPPGDFGPRRGPDGGDPAQRRPENRRGDRMFDGFPDSRPGPPETFPVREISVESLSYDGHHWRIAVLASPVDLLVITADLGPYYAESAAIRNTFVLIVAAAIAAIGLGAWLLAQRALRPVEALIRAAESITAQELERRLPESGASEEFDRLNRVFNQMLERLDRSFKQATRFSADAAHELKTPLTILQGQLNQALQEAPPGSPLQQKLGMLLDEVQRLTVIIRRLLLLSLADAGRLKVSLAPLSLDGFLETILEDVEILAPELDASSELCTGVVVNADAALLQQAVQNLVNNAIKYNIPGGKIRFSLFRHEGAVRFSVANTSKGISEEDRKRVFHRFFRGDPAHSREVDGLGLGLSLAREIVRSHHGKLWLADAPEGWVMFVMELPIRVTEG